MSVANSGEDIPSSRNADELESPRKRLRLGNSSRKSWSLMDRRTDQEVLQEMGVSLLEPDENETPCEFTPSTASSGLQHKSLKRKRDIENMNPNANSASPRTKLSPKSPRSRGKCSPGSSKGKSPRSLEKVPLQETDLETTLLEEYLIEEETPLNQCVSGKYSSNPCQVALDSTGGRQRVTTHNSLPLEEQAVTWSTSCSDSFSVLSDEMMLSVFRWLPKLSLQHCMLVCKRWYRMACDETLWQRLDLGNRTLSKNALGRILERKPIIVRLANSEIGEWHPTTLPTSRIQYLDLSVTSVDVTTLDNLLASCPALKKISLESVGLARHSCRLVGKCKNLETLNLTMTQGITAEGLKAILDGCQNLISLNISWTNLSPEALEVLVTSLPRRLQRLNLAGARTLTSHMVSQLVARCPRLLELDLSDCSLLDVQALEQLQSLSRLDHLALSRCYLLPPHALTKLGSMPSLQFLDVWGMLPSKSLAALRSALPALQLNQFMFSAIARPTVGAKRTSIWGLRTRD